MIRRSFVVAALAMAGPALVGCSEDAPIRDIGLYCTNYEALADNNPFLTLHVASPDDVRAAFDDLAAAADSLDRSAPEGLDRLAASYADSVRRLDELLDDAGFDPRFIDPPIYGRAVIDYEDAATALSKETRARCDLDQVTHVTAGMTSRHPG